MSAQIPDTHADLLTGPIFVTLTTISPSGAPENTIVWCSWDGTHVLVNTAEGRRKPKNVRANPKVAAHGIGIRRIHTAGSMCGASSRRLCPTPDYSNINAHTKVYAGADEYYGSVMPAEMKGTEERVIFKIKPLRVAIFPPA